MTLYAKHLRSDDIRERNGAVVGFALNIREHFDSSSIGTNLFILKALSDYN